MSTPKVKRVRKTVKQPTTEDPIVVEAPREAPREAPEVQEAPPTEAPEAPEMQEAPAETPNKRKEMLNEAAKCVEDDLCSLIDSYQDMKTNLNYNVMATKRLMKNFKRIQYSLKHTKMRRDDVKKEFSGFASKTKKILLSPELCEFLGEEPNTRLIRSEASGRVHAYIKEHKRVEASDKRNIILDAKLEKLFGDSEFRMNTMSEHVQRNKHKKKKSNGKGDEENKVTDNVHYFNLQIHLQRHFIKEPKEPKVQQVEYVSATATA